MKLHILIFFNHTNFLSIDCCVKVTKLFTVCFTHGTIITLKHHIHITLTHHVHRSYHVVRKHEKIVQTKYTLAMFRIVQTKYTLAMFRSPAKILHPITSNVLTHTYSIKYKCNGLKFSGKKFLRDILVALFSILLLK